MNWIYRPIDAWPGDLTPNNKRQCTRFKAKLSDTLDLLGDELGHLRVKEAVIQLALEPQDLRRDGLPRAGSKPAHPGVIVSFESKHGPLRYFTDAFKACYFNDGEGWHSNLRAIALGLSDLRRLDRYGIGKRGEAYAGWAQLPPGQSMGHPNGKMTVEEAARFLADAAYDGLSDGRSLIGPAGQGFVAEAWRRAAKRHHPDHGGDPAAFRRLTEARELLEHFA